MHRFNTNISKFVKEAQDWKLISVSCGVNGGTELMYFQKIASEKLRVDFITIDVAHGHHLKVKNRIAWLKEKFPKTRIIAGNVATPQAVKDLISWGADAIKVCIGSGSICTTKLQTGFSYPNFSCVENCSWGHYLSKELGKPFPKIEYFDTKVPIIADGGIKHPGDISKAIRAGADMVMTGSLFAPCIDSPAEIKNGKKQYYGSTSFEAKKENKHIEGRLLEIESGVTFEERLKEIKMALQSSISYAGGKDLGCLKTVDYIVI